MIVHKIKVEKVLYWSQNQSRENSLLITTSK